MVFIGKANHLQFRNGLFACNLDIWNLKETFLQADNVNSDHSTQQLLLVELFTLCSPAELSALPSLFHLV